MKKLLSFTFLSVLTLCLTMQFAQAMKRERDEDDHKERAHLPIEIQEKIAIKGLEKGLDFYFSAVRVCKTWRDFLTPFVISQPLAKQLKDSDLERYPDVRILILDELGDDHDHEIKSITNVGLQQLTNLTYLSLIGNWNITDDGIQSLTQLIHLYIRNGDGAPDEAFFISNNGIKGLTNLQKLTLPSVSRGRDISITGEGIKELRNLTDLDLYGNTEFLIEDIMHLKNLTALNLNETEKSIKDKGGIECLTQLRTLLFKNSREYLTCINCHRIRKLTNLTRLHLAPAKTTTDDDLEVLTHLVNLTELDLPLDKRHSRVTDEGLKFINRLPNLATFNLDLNGNLKITDKGILYLTNISRLTINENMAFKGIKNLTNITSLDLGEQKSVSHKIKFLTNLTNLNLNNNQSITEKEIFPLTNLTCLNLGGNKNFNRYIDLEMSLRYSDKLVKALPKLTRLGKGRNSTKWVNVATQTTNGELRNFPQDFAETMTDDDGNLKITSKENVHLTDIACLTINENTAFKGIKNLTNITSLDLGDQISVSHKIKFLTNLTSLNLNHNESMTEQEIFPLTNLTCLNLGENKNFDKCSNIFLLDSEVLELLNISSKLTRLGRGAYNTQWIHRADRTNSPCWGKKFFEEQPF